MAAQGRTAADTKINPLYLLSGINVHLFNTWFFGPMRVQAFLHSSQVCQTIDVENIYTVDTRHSIATAADRVATNYFQKLQSQEGGLP